jgi:Integrase core domain.
LGQTFQASGMLPDDTKIEAIQNMPVPMCVKDLQRFLGMINYLASYVPNLSERCTNLRKLLRKDTVWCWESQHDAEFEDLKSIICQSPVLQFFDSSKPIVLSVDASQGAVGACLLQNGKPVAYSSKSLTETQKHWSQIEKETFSCWYGLTKMHQYVYGQSIVVETDHKPLITLFKKSLADVPTRLQRLMMKIQMYDIQVVYKAGKEMYVSDTLSRAALKETCTEFDESLAQDLAIHTNMFYRTLNASDAKLNEICEATKNDKTLQRVKSFILSGWPEYKNSVPKVVLPFYSLRNELHVINGIIFKGSCIVLPKSMQAEMLKSMHSSHMGYNKNKNFVKNVIFWPTMYLDLKNFIMNCETCKKFQPSNRKEPLIPHEVPNFPWEKVAVDLFDFERSKYLIIVDYYSKFFETVLLSSSTSQVIIKHFKSIFSRQGVPAQLISDGGPPFSSKELQSFYTEWNIEHKCSSPYYPRSNGLVEQTVKLVKSTLYKCKEDGADPYLAMLHLRNSCADNQETPAKLLYARNLRTNLPISNSQLRTSPVPFNRFKAMNKKRIVTMKSQYDKGAKSLPKFKA